MKTAVDSHATSHDIEISDPSRLPAAPVVSVLMLAYNHGAYLAEAIESILMQQADFAIELLIGDDCSSDDTREIALRYQEARPDVIRVITHAYNVGMHRNHRRLAQAVRGEFIAFCEGDDYWTSPAKLRLQVEYLRRHPDVGAVHSEFCHTLFRNSRWRTLANFQRTIRGSVPEGEIFPQLLAGNFIQTCTLCVRTALDRQYLASDLPMASYPVGDWPLCLFIASQSKIGYLPQSLAAYRKVPGSAMNSGYVVRSRLVAGYLPMIDDFCRHSRVDEATRIGVLAVIHRAQFSCAVLAGDMPLFERTHAWLAQNDPDFLRPWRRRLLPLLARSPFVRRVLTTIDAVRVCLREIREYK